MKNKKDIVSLTYIALLVIMIIRILNISIVESLTSDNYFLINTGKYIIENKSIPTINIWTMHEDFKIVVQQWLCCIENYLAYNLGNKMGLAVITVLHTMILNILLIWFISLYTNNKRITIIALCVANYLVSSFMNARPSLVTMSILTYELIQLELWNRSAKDKKSNIKLLINLAFISLFHINYHSALWLMDILFILPYMIPAIWDKKSLYNSIKQLIISITIIVVMAFLNPNGLNAIKYLSNSTEMFKIWNLDELMPWELNSINSIVIISIIVLLTIYVVKGDKNKSLIYLTSGTIILSILYRRNYWMPMFGIIRLLIFFLDKREPKRFTVSKNKYLALATLYTIIISTWTIVLTSQSLHSLTGTYDNSYIVVDAVEYLNSLPDTEKDNLVIYNEFGNGAYLEFNGYKAYIDARPELYMKSINGKVDIYQEWVNLRNGVLDIPKFIEKYGFNTFIVENRTILDCYLHYSDNYEKVMQGNGYKVYRINN